MAGAQVNVIRRTDYGFSMPVSTSQDVVLAPLIDTLGWVSAVLIVRLYAKTFAATTATVTVVVQNAMVGPEDEVTVLVPSTDLATAQIVNADVAPKLIQAVIAPGTQGLGRYMRVLMRYAQGANLGAQTFTLGIDLVGRSA